MKQLIIARHAKSSWEDILCPDFDRWLNDRGKKDLLLLSGLLWDTLKKPDYIIASPAKRTTKTAEAYAKAWWYKKKHIEREKSLYEASLSTLCTVIEKTQEKVDRLVLVGHNPGLTALINHCGYVLDNLPTWGVVVFDYTGELRWNFEQKKCIFVKRYFPKELE